VSTRGFNRGCTRGWFARMRFPGALEVSVGPGVVTDVGSTGTGANDSSPDGSPVVGVSPEHCMVRQSGRRWF